jgi:hypothetical protein
MQEREAIKNILEFAFTAKAKLHSDEAALLRSILTIAIMESEDLIEKIDENQRENSKMTLKSARR